MRHLSKKLLAVLLSVVMAIPTLLVVPFSAEAVTEWTAVASSDFTQLTNAVSNGSLGSVPTYDGKGSAMEWSTGAYIGNGEVTVSSNGLFVPDGYIYLSGYEGSGVPIKNSSNWKMEVGFRFRNVTENDVHVTDGYHADEEHCFIKMYNGTAALSAPENALHDACYFEQNANGQVYAGNYTVGEGATNPDNAVCTGSKNLDAETEYKYVAEFSDGVFKAYIQDENGGYVQFINETDDEDFIGALSNTSAVNSIKLGDDNNSAFFRSLEYKYIVFSTGVQTGTVEDQMKEAIELYETKMGGDIFTGMTAAYDAYVQANKVYDAWKYGDGTVTDSDLEAAATALRKKSVAMKQWSYNGYSGVTPWYDGDSGDNSAYANNGVANILYWQNAENVASNKNANVTIDIWLPSRTVLLLDGVKTPAMPVMAFAKMDVNKNRYVYNLYPCVSSSDNTNSSYFRLGTVNNETAWYGHNGTNDRSRDWIWGVTSSDSLGRPKGEAGTDTSKRLQLSKSGTIWITYYWASMANVMKFVGNQSNALESYSLNWSRLTGDQASDTNIFSSSNSIQVLNYKMLLDKMNDGANINKINVAEDTYTQGGLRSLLAAYDQATAVDITSYDYSSDSGVNAAGEAINSAVSAFNSASVTEDVAGYDALRKALGAKKVTYDGGSEGYTEESWAAFAQAYEAAQAIFTNIQTTGYNDGANAKAKADALNAVELVTKVEKVNTESLETSINEAVEAINNSNMFTTASYEASNIEAVVNTAKVAIWGAAANYPNAKDKLDLSDENTAIVETQLDAVNAAIYALRIDKATIVASAGEQSMNSAIALAATYSSDDYGNYQDLTSAVSAANSFVAFVNTVSEGCISNKIAEYKTKVRAIINAINLLRPAFDKITNGTIAGLREGIQTEIDSTEREKDPRWRLYFTRNNDVVVFRTKYDSFTVDLGGATLEWWTSENFDADLDSVNLFDENTTTGELCSGTGAQTLSNPDDYPGMLSAFTEENSTYTLKNLTITQPSSDTLGRDEQGNNINTSTILDSFLSTTQGASTDSREGTVTANNGTTIISGDFIISIPREAKKTLSATTVPVVTEHTLSGYMGMVYAWKYRPFATYFGYSHNRAEYSQTTYVINIAPLMELITKARAEEENEKNYQLTAWNNFASALSAARADMDYGNMTVSGIEAECQTRYTNLWTAYKALESAHAATNASIHAAVEGNEEVGNAYKADNKDGKWSAARWATFKNAYEAAVAAIADGGTYSDTNVRNYTESEQDAIDAIAAALTTAYNELIQYGGRADFSPVLDAAAQGAQALADDTYTAASLADLADALADATQFPYLNMSEADRNAVYSEPENLEAIAAEAVEIEGKFTTIPQTADIDASALAAAQEQAMASITDPDAYGNIDEIKALINATQLNESVAIYSDYSVSGMTYATQEELNAAVMGILAGLQTKQYTVTVVDANNNALDVVFEDMEGNAIASENGTVTVEYGTRIRAYAPSTDAVDWFYSYNSNTVSQTASKYYTTDKWINVTVKGNTTLTVKSAAQETETVKVTYVNALTGKTFAVDYAAKNETYTFAAAPALAYYTFNGYTLEAGSTDYIESATPAEDIVVFANYSFDDVNNEYFEVYIGNIGSLTNLIAVGEELKYNDLVEFQLGDGSADEETGGLYRSSTKNSGQFKINGEVVTLPGKKGTRYTVNEIYAWVVVKESDMELWDENRADYLMHVDELADTEKVVMYGEKFSFRVCENIYVIPYTEDDFNEMVSKGIVKVGDNNNAAVFANNKIVNETNGEKISMIGNFTLPAGNFELVEAGMLFKATTDGSEPTGDLTLGNAGANGISRMKSSQHTSGNQFVISVNTSKLKGKGITVKALYRAYMIYTDGTEQIIVYSDGVTDSAEIE